MVEESQKCRGVFTGASRGPGGEMVSENRNRFMAKIVKVIELLAQSDKSWEDAAQAAVAEAAKTLRHIKSVYVKEFEAAVEDGKITQYRVNVKISFDFEGAP